LSTPEGKAFWDSAELIAQQAEHWPDSKLAGINVSPTRQKDPIGEFIGWIIYIEGLLIMSSEKWNPEWKLSTGKYYLYMGELSKLLTR
jgi:hypothetical protein